MCTKLALTGAQADTLSPRSGFDYEGWALIFYEGMGWMLAQAVVLVLLRGADRFPTLAFATAAFFSSTPFVADPTDTAKDSIFAGLACRCDWPWKGIGWLSLAWLWGLHFYMLWDTELVVGLERDYLSVLIIQPTPTSTDLSSEEVAPTSGTSAEAAPPASAPHEDPENTPLVPSSEGGGGTTTGGALTAAAQSAHKEILTFLFKQSVPERQKAMMLEDGPQGVMAALYLVGTGKFDQTLVMVSNILVPAARILFAKVAHPRLLRHPIVVSWLAKEAISATQAQSPMSVFWVGYMWAAIEAGAGESAEDELRSAAFGSEEGIHRWGLAFYLGRPEASQALESGELNAKDFFGRPAASPLAARALAGMLKASRSFRILNLEGSNLGPEAERALQKRQMTEPPLTQPE